MQFMNTEHKVLTSSQARRRYALSFLIPSYCALGFAWLMRSTGGSMSDLIAGSQIFLVATLLSCICMYNMFILRELSAPGLRKLHECLKSLPEVAPMFSDALSQGLKLRQRDLHHVIVLHRIAVARQAELKAASDIICLGESKE